MPETDNEARCIMNDLFGRSPESSGIEQAIENCKIDRTNANKLMSLIEIMRGKIWQNTRVFYGILNLHLKFSNAQLIDPSSYFALMVGKRYRYPFFLSFSFYLLIQKLLMLTTP